MPEIFYSYYESEDLSVSEAASLEHELGRRLLAYGLFRLYGINVSLTELESMLGTDINGKPYLPSHPEIFFNITHCSGLAACGFSGLPIGIDAELPGYFAEVLIDRVLAQSEKEQLHSALPDPPDPALRREIFWRFWTLKEAYVKLSGYGVDSDLTSVSFTLADDCAKNVSFIPCSDTAVCCYQMQLSRGHILSLCTAKPVPAEFYIHHIVF